MASTDERALDAATESVARLDALAIDLDEAGFTAVAGRVSDMADAVESLGGSIANVSDLVGTPRDQRKAIARLEGTVDPAIADLGTC